MIYRGSVCRFKNESLIAFYTNSNQNINTILNNTIDLCVRVHLSATV